MATRVQLGKLPSGDYGLRVIGPDGATVIIDGTSNMFKIIAVGSIDQDCGASTMASSVSVTLNGLGAFAATPGHQSYLSASASGTGVRGGGFAMAEAGSVKFAASTSGGSPTSPSGTFDVVGSIRTALDSNSYCEVSLRMSNALGFAVHWYGFFYILQEVAA